MLHFAKMVGFVLALLSLCASASIYDDICGEGYYFGDIKYGRMWQSGSGSREQCHYMASLKAFCKGRSLGPISAPQMLIYDGPCPKQLSDPTYDCAGMAHFTAYAEAIVNNTCIADLFITCKGMGAETAELPLGSSFNRRGMSVACNMEDWGKVIPVDY